MNGAATRTICLSEEGVAEFNKPRVGSDQVFVGLLGMELILQAEKMTNLNKPQKSITPMVDPSCDIQARKDFEAEICTRFPFMDICGANSGITELTIGSEEQDRAAYAVQVERGQRVAQLYKQCRQIKVNG